MSQVATESSSDDSFTDSGSSDLSLGDHAAKTTKRKNTPGPKRSKSSVVTPQGRAVQLIRQGDDVTTEENVLDTEGGDDSLQVMIPSKTRRKARKTRSTNSGSPGEPRKNLANTLDSAATAPGGRKRKQTPSPRTPAAKGHKTSKSQSGLLVPSSILSSILY